MQEVYAKVSRFMVLLVALFLLAACGERQPLLKLSGDAYPEKLSDWGIYNLDKGYLTLNLRVLPYDLNTPLFTDYASKLRTVWVPEGAQAELVDGEIVFPVGTILSKTFYYPVADKQQPDRVVPSGGQTLLFKPETGLPLNQVRLIETRILLRQQSGWVALPYVWNENQTDAVLEWAGESKILTVVHEDGRQESFSYVVPDANQCSGCHAPEAYKKAIEPLGPRVRHLNKDFAYADSVENQLLHWANKGVLATVVNPALLPANALWPQGRLGESQDFRARSYLDASCSHCHNPNGAGNTSGLFLTLDTPQDTRLGLCKRPIAAGRGSGNHLVAIKPGASQDSILVFRMNSKDPAEMMPELGRSLTDHQGVELISQWIDAMDSDC